MSRPPRKRARRSRPIEFPEMLEDRTLLSVSLTGVPDWVEQGPGPITGGQDQGLFIQQDPVTGPVAAIAVVPGDPNTLYVGAFNGGVWKTTDATSPSPHWTALTDQEPSLQIRSLVLDPNDPTHQTLYAGTRDSDPSRPGHAGILRTTDGGNTWEVLGADTFSALLVRDVYPTPRIDPGTGQRVILAATDALKDEGRGGLYISNDNGATWRQVSGTGGTLPGGSMTSMVQDPGDLDRFYAAVSGPFDGSSKDALGNAITTANKGVFRSDDDGATWTRIDNVTNGLPVSGTLRIKLAVGVSPDPVYAALINGNDIAGLYRSTNLGGSWTRLSLPTSTENVNGTQTAFGLFPGKQAFVDFSMAVDPTNPDVVYVAGDRQPGGGIVGEPNFPNSIGADNFTGRVFSGNTSAGQSTTWSQVVANGAGGTAPHADSRYMTFANGTLFEGDDGGIYQLNNPGTPAQRWSSENGDLQLTQFYTVAYDSTNQEFIGGAQDVGVSQQTTPGGLAWSTVTVGNVVQQGDGVFVAVDNSNPNAPIRYSATQGLGQFVRRTFDSTGHVVSSAFVGLLVGGRPLVSVNQRLGFRSRFTLNAVAANPNVDAASRTAAASRMLVATETASTPGGSLYESVDQGDHLALLIPTGFVTAIAYGGVSGGTANPDVAYIGKLGGTDHLLVRTTRTGVAANDFKPADLPGNVVPRSIVLDPTDWRTAYATDGINVFRTTDAGATWTTLRPGPPTEGIKSLEIVKAPGHDVLLAGGTEGIFRLIDPATNTNWARLAGVATGMNPLGMLPNVPVNDIHYDARTDTLVIGTAGRGAWEITSAAAALSAPGALQVTDSGGNNSVRLVLDPNDPTLLDVFDSANNTGLPNLRVPLASLNSVNINLQGGNDTLAVDSSRGAIVVPGSINYTGAGPTDTLLLSGAGTSLISTNDGSNNGTERVLAKGGIQTVVYTSVGSVNNQLPPTPTIATLASALQTVVDSSAQWDGPTMLGLSSPVFGNALGSWSDGVTQPNGEPDNSDQSVGAEAPPDGVQGVAILRRFFEEGANGFSLSDIGNTIATPDDLRTRLAALDPNGTVTLTQANGVTSFEVNLTRTLSGDALLNTLALGGKIDLSGTVGLSADVTLHVIFGIDSHGFFLDPISTLDPMLTIRNFQVGGDLQGSGQLGFVGVQFNGGTLRIDPSVQLTLSLNQTAPDPFTGTFDHLLRIDQLDPSTPGLITAQWQGGSGHDFVFTPSLDVAPLAEGGSPLLDLGTDPAQVSLTWANVASANDPTVAGANTEGNTLVDFLNVSAAQLAGGLASLAGDFNGLLQLHGSVMGSSFGVTGSLGSILGGPASNVALSASSVVQISPLYNEGGFNKFVVTLTQGSLSPGSIAVGDTVTYQGLDSGNVSHSVQGVIDGVRASEFTVRFNDNLVQTPDPANRAFTITTAGSIQHQLQASLGSLVDPTTADAQAPTLQDLLIQLSDLTGTDPSTFPLALNGSGASLGLQIGLDFNPQPIHVAAGVDLSSLVPGLKLGSANDLAFTITPHLHVLAGLLLSSGITAQNRFYLGTDSSPTVSLQLAATPAAPIAGTGTVGYLNVSVSADPSIPNNPGISIGGTITATLTDPGTVANDGRITGAEIQPSDLSTLFTTGVSQTDPLVVNVPGLLVTATVGSTPPSPVHISLDGTSTGRLTSLSALSNLATNASSMFTVNGVGNFTSYDNISPDTVVQALAGLAQQLGVAGGGGVFATKLPLIGQSLSDVINLAQQFRDQVHLPTATDIPTAQDLLNFLVNHLGAANVGLTARGNELDISLSFAQDVTPKTYTVGLGLGSALSSLVPANGSGQITLQAHSAVNLAFGISTAAGNLFDRVFIDTNDTDIAVNAQADAGYILPQQQTIPAALSFNVGIGPLSFGVSNARFLLRPSFDAHLNSGPSVAGQAKLSELSPGSVTGSLDGDAQAIIPIQGASGNAEVDVTGLLAQAPSITYGSDDNPNYAPNPATMPVNPGSISGFSVFVHHQSALLPTGSFDIGTVNLDELTGGLDGLLDPIHTLLNSNALGKISLPLIGKLSDAAQFIETIKADIQQALTDLKNTNPTPTPAQVQTALLNAAGLSSLLSSNTLTVVAAQDQVEVKLHINHTFPLASIPLAADFGFPGLNFKVDPGTTFNLDLPVDFAFGFGYSQKDGVFFDTGAAQDLGLNHTLTVGLTASVQGLNVQGQLGFLRMMVSPIGSGAPFTSSLQFHVDVTNPVGDNHLTPSILLSTSFGDILDASLSGSVNADVHLAADFGTREFPGIGADFHLAWAFGTGDGDPTMSGGVPQVSFTHVTLNLGTFFSGEVAPILNDIQSVLGPLKPVFDFLVKPIPVISDLEGKNFTVLDAAGYGYLDPVAQVVDQILNLTVPDASNGANVPIDLGDFNLGGSDIRTLGDLSGVAPNLLRQAQDAFAQINNAIPGNLEVPFLQDLQTQASTATTDGLHFPLLENPKIAFNLLLGKPVDLVEFGVPDINVQEHENEFFPIFGPIGVRLIGDLVVHTKLVFGYDTQGFQENPIRPLDGFFIDDTSHVSVHADAAAGLELNVAVAQAGVKGGVTGDVTIGLNDPDNDGKLRLSEIGNALSSNPLALFTAQGKVEASLDAYVKVGVDTPLGFAGWSDS